jgi:pilus assembly protein Flp/PilA
MLCSAALGIMNEFFLATGDCGPDRVEAHPRRNPEDKMTPMKNLAQRVRQFLVSEDGPTAGEYAVMLALIIIVCLVAITAVGTQASTTFSNVAGSLGGAS